MPKWGLSETQRESRPWGLSPELLRPSKTISDPVHGDIYITELERLLLDSPPMQRLRRVNQLGTTHLVYPSATHSRFSHALGTLRATQDLLDAVADNRRGPRHVPDLLDEWSRGGLLDVDRKLSVLDARFAEATVLARLGGLLHDLCHVPLGHTIEDDLKVLVPHDENLDRFKTLWQMMDPSARRAIDRGKSLFDEETLGLKSELMMLILSKLEGNPASDSAYPFVGDIVGNTICADLIDYLQRDHAFTGLPIALGHRFMGDFYVMGSDHLHFAKRMIVRITRYGHPREDVVTELIKFLRYRYELTERVLNHHTKISADAMMGKLLEIWHDALWIERARERYPAIVLGHGTKDIDKVQAAIFEHDPTPLPKRAGDVKSAVQSGLKRSLALKQIDEEVVGSLETAFLQHSDSGLLEFLAVAEIGHDGERTTAVHDLAQAILDRKLFKLAGRADTAADFAIAKKIYDKFSPPPVMRQIEQRAAKCGELEHGWQVVVWLPNPDMRLKVAQVLVQNEEGVAHLDAVADAGGHIVAQHKHLWAISVFVPRDVLSNDRRMMATLSSIKTDMGVRLFTHDGKLVPTIAELAEETVSRRAGIIDDLAKRRAILALVPAARGNETFREVVHALWFAAERDNLLKGPPPKDLW